MLSLLIVIFPPREFKKLHISITSGSKAQFTIFTVAFDFTHNKIMFIVVPTEG